MSGEEDEKELELKDLIVQTLEANGLLSKIKVRNLILTKLIQVLVNFTNNFYSFIKAQLRASVFSALDENDKEANVIFQSFYLYDFLLEFSI